MSGGLKVGLINISSAVIQLATIYVLNRLIGIEGFGFYTVLVTIAVVSSNMGKLGMDSYIMRLVPAIHENNPDIAIYLATKKIINGVLATLIASASIGAILCYLSSNSLSSSNYILVIVYCVISVLKIEVSALLRSTGELVKSHILMKMAEPTVLLAILLLVSVTESGVDLVKTLPILMILSITIALIVTKPNILARYFKQKKISQPQEIHQNKSNDLERTAYTFTNILSMIASNADILVINYFSGTSSVGIYAIIKKTLNQIYMIVSIMQIKDWRELSLLWSTDKIQDLNALIFDAKKTINLLQPFATIAASLVMIYLIEDSGESFNGTILWTALAYAIGVNISAYFIYSGTLMNLCGRHHKLWKINLISLLVYIATIIAGEAEILYCAIGYILMQLINNIWMKIELKKAAIII